MTRVDNLENSPEWIKFQKLFKDGYFIDSEFELDKLKSQITSEKELEIWDLHKGMLDYELGQYSDAESRLTSTLDKIGDKNSAYYVYKARIFLCMLYCRTARVDKSFKKLELVLNDENIRVFPDLHALALNWQGNGHWLAGKLDVGLEYHQQALEIRTKLNDLIGITQTMNNIGIIYRVQGKLTEALELFNKALGMDSQNLKSSSYLYVNRGTIYFELGDYEDAIKNHEKAYKLRLKSGGDFLIADSIFNLIKTLAPLKDFARIKNYLKQFPETSQEYTRTQALQSMVKAVVYHTEGKRELSIECWETALAIQGIEFGYQIYCHEGIIEILVQQWRDGEANVTQTKIFDQLQKWEVLTKSNSLIPSLCKVYIIRANIHKLNMEWGDARKYLTQCILIASETGLPLHEKLAKDDLKSLNVLEGKIGKIYTFEQKNQEVRLNLDETLAYIKNLPQALAKFKESP